MTLNQAFPPHMRPENPITERILKDPNIVWDVADDALVVAMKGQLLVSGSIRDAVRNWTSRCARWRSESEPWPTCNGASGRPATITTSRGGRQWRLNSSTWPKTSRSGG